MRGKLLFLLGCILSSSTANPSENSGEKPARPPLTAFLVEELESWEDLLEKERSRALESLPSLTGNHIPLRPPANS